MASLKEMRNRIDSVKSTQKITKALNMVAAAKLKRAQDQAESARPYAKKMAAVIANLAAGIQKTPLSHEEVIQAGKDAEVRISGLLAEIVSKL